VERDQFLGRVRAALRGTRLPETIGPDPAPPISFGDPVARYVVAAGEAGAEIVQVEGPEAARGEIVRIAADEAFGRSGQAGFVAWDGRIEASVGTESRLDDHQRVANASLGITGADVAIAATGSVVLGHGSGRPRAASLLVEHHIVLLPIDRIVASLQEALEITDWSMASNWVAITGPSRTGDIESILTLGVHGPRTLSIVLIR